MNEETPQNVEHAFRPLSVRVLTAQAGDDVAPFSWITTPHMLQIFLTTTVPFALQSRQEVFLTTEEAQTVLHIQDGMILTAEDRILQPLLTILANMPQTTVSFEAFTMIKQALLRISIQDLLDQLGQKQEAYHAMAERHGGWTEESTVIDHPLCVQLDTEIPALSAAIKQHTLEYGRSVQGATLQATWQPGTPQWDTEGLMRFAAQEPRILQFYKPGQPHITIGPR